jgi:hypothetical protein
MMRKPLIWLLLLWTWPALAQVTFNSPLQFPLQSEVVNQAGQQIGTKLAGALSQPQLNQNVPPFALFPAPPLFLGKNAILPDLFGRAADEITDGINVASIAPAGRAAALSNSALVVAVSPNPRLTCPFIQAINQTANATVITNPGGKLIHVCNLVILDGATQQGISLAEGTGTACATNTIYWDGGAGGTMQTAIGGGWVLPGQEVNYPMQNAGDNVCVIQSGSTNVSGHLTYGIYNR